MKELHRIKQEYFEDRRFKYGAFCNPRKSKKILDYIYNATPFDKPDFYYHDNRKCFLFEHFEFDASKKIEKCGSLSKRNLNVANREIDQEWKTATSMLKINQVTTLGPIIKTVENYANKESWKNNFCNTFDEHYEKLKIYQDNLHQELGKKIKLINCFVIEDSTELGGLYYNNGKVHHTLVSLFDFAIQKMKNSKKIKYFIYLNRQDCFCLIVSKAKLKKLAKNKLNFSKTDIIFFNQTHIVSSCISVPSNIIDKK